MSFSERMGLKPARSMLQIDDIDQPLRVALYNLLYGITSGSWYRRDGNEGTGYVTSKIVWTEFFRKPIDSFNEYPAYFADELKVFVDRRPWYEVYDLLEFCAVNSYEPFNEETANWVLERDMSGYRVRAGKVVPITDAVELEAIDEALTVDDDFRGAREHIREALAKLARRPSPDLRNSITEAISAVESAARIVTGKQKATLADALKTLEKSGHVHPALKEAWVKLYGYTSDEQGLRHAMTEDPNIDFSTAKYMVVTCSAFVNLLSASR